MIELPFAGKKLRVSYRNEARKDYGEYRITSASLDGKPLSVEAGDHLILPRAELLRLSEGLHEIDITLN